MCGAKLGVGKQNDSTTLQSITTPCIDDHHFKEEEMKSVGELSQVCSEMFILGTNWTTRYSMVSEQTCKIHHKMDQSLAREMGSPRQGLNRRRRAREGPEPACVQTPLVHGWHTQEGNGEITSCRGTV